MLMFFPFANIKRGKKKYNNNLYSSPHLNEKSWGGGDRVLILERAAQSKVNKFQYLFFVVFAVRTLETTT
jgi:hypothetical protein